MSSLAPAAWLRLPTRTARLRLTVLYAGMFLVLGTALLALTFVLTTQSSTIHARTATPVAVVRGTGAASAAPLPGAAALLGTRVPLGVASEVQPGVADQQRNADLGRLLEVSWVVLALTTLGSAILGWFAAGRVLRPLRSITTTARTISAGNLHQRLALTGPDDEFKQLSDTLDELLGRLEASFEAQRRFVANASHELRTPLTVERTLLQVALANPRADEQSLRSTCEELLASQVEHERLLEGLLTLASSERGLDHRETCDLASLTACVLGAAGPEMERRELEVGSSLSGAQVSGDAALIRRLVANLIGNAVDHNVAGGRLEVNTHVETGVAVLAIENTGPDVPPEHIERLFEPFERLNGRRAGTEGHHGLGLSIVRAIAAAHGASAEARARPGGGLVVTVRFAEASQVADS